MNKQRSAPNASMYKGATPAWPTDRQEKLTALQKPET